MHIALSRSGVENARVRPAAYGLFPLEKAPISRPTARTHLALLVGWRLDAWHVGKGTQEEEPVDVLRPEAATNTLRNLKKEKRQIFCLSRLPCSSDIQQEGAKVVLCSFAPVLALADPTAWFAAFSFL